MLRTPVSFFRLTTAESSQVSLKYRQASVCPSTFSNNISDETTRPIVTKFLAHPPESKAPGGAYRQVV